MPPISWEHINDANKIAGLIVPLPEILVFVKLVNNPSLFILQAPGDGIDLKDLEFSPPVALASFRIVCSIWVGIAGNRS